MAYLKISFGNAIFTTLLLVSYATGITGTICSYDFAEVAHMSEFELESRLDHEQWYSEGMQLFAYCHTGPYWEKRCLTWALANESRSMSRQRIEAGMTIAFQKWAAKSSFTFVKVSSDEQADIQISFQSRQPEFISQTVITNEKRAIDDEGATIVFNDTKNWTNIHGARYINALFVALHEIGHVLGLGNSSDHSSIMYAGNLNLISPVDPVLGEDDIDGIRNLYKTPEDASKASSKNPTLP